MEGNWYFIIISSFGALIFQELCAFAFEALQKPEGMITKKRSFYQYLWNEDNLDKVGWFTPQDLYYIYSRAPLTEKIQHIQLPSKCRSSKEVSTEVLSCKTERCEHCNTLGTKRSEQHSLGCARYCRGARRARRRRWWAISRPRIRETSESVSCFFRGTAKELRAWSWATESQPQSVLSLESSANYRAQRSYIPSMVL